MAEAKQLDQEIVMSQMQKIREAAEKDDATIRENERTIQEQRKIMQANQDMILAIRNHLVELRGTITSPKGIGANEFTLYTRKKLVSLRRLVSNKPPSVLFVVTNHTKLGNLDKKTGWYLPEVAHPYYVLKRARFEIQFASPRGGLAAVDPGSVEAFAKDDECVKFLKEEMDSKENIKTTSLSDISSGQFSAIFFAGGHGVMWDGTHDICKKITASIYENGGIVSAVCHGPAGLVDVRLSNGEYLISGKNVTGFTNSEERAVKLDSQMPFLLETTMKDRGAKFSGAADWSCNVIQDGRVITGQNPASAGGVGEALVKALR